MNELSTASKVMVLSGGARYYLTASEYQAINNSLRIKDNWILEIQGDMVMRSAIQFICSPDKLEKADRIKNGEFYCKFGNWHDKGVRCECVAPDKEKEWKEYRERFYKENGFYPLK